MGSQLGRNIIGTGTSSSPGGRPTVLPVLLFLLLLSTMTALADRPPKPLGLTASTGTFSAARAFSAYVQALGDGTPHPTGSAAQERMRDRLIAQFRRMGYEPQIQVAWVCSRWTHAFALVQNIVVRLEGLHNDGTVLVTAHYDSVPCGPGAMDDGSGTAAVLEIARAFRLSPKPLHSVIFLLSDGEEIGLLGAKAFLEHHPWAGSVRTVVGIDAGGDGGSSLLSQTAGNDQSIMKAFESIRHPVGSSAIGSFLEAFHLVGGTSDFDEYEKAGRSGVNLINSGWYFNHHTPWDNPERMNLRTLQDQGDHALALLRELANGKGKAARTMPGVFFDLFGRVLVHYSRVWVWVIQFISLIFGLPFLLLGSRQERGAWFRSALKGLGGWALVITAGTVGGGLTIFIANGFTWPPIVASGDPVLVLAAILTAAAVAGLSMFQCIDCRRGNDCFRQGTWLAWNLGGIIACVFLPGASYLFSLPALAIGVFVLLIQAEEEDNFTPWIPGVVVAGLLWLPLLLRLAAVEPPNILSAILFMMLWSLILPMIRGKRRWSNGMFAVLSVLVLMLPWMVLNGPAGERPQSYGNIVYWVDAGKEEAFWILPGRTPTPIWRAAGRVNWRKLKNPILGLERKLPLANASWIGMPQPEATLESRDNLPGGRTRLHIRVRSGRQARVIWIAVSPYLLTLKADGIEMTQLPSDHVSLRKHSKGKDTWERCVFVGKPDVDLELVVQTRNSVKLSVVDQTEGLPSFGEKLLKARPLDSVPYQNGDLMLAAKTFSF